MYVQLLNDRIIFNLFMQQRSCWWQAGPYLIYFEVDQNLYDQFSVGDKFCAGGVVSDVLDQRFYTCYTLNNHRVAKTLRIVGVSRNNDCLSDCKCEQWNCVCI